MSSVWRLGADLLRYGRWRVFLVVLMTLGLTFTSGIGLVMLVPFLQLAGLDVGEGSIGQVAQIASATLGTIGLTPSLPSVIAAYLVVVVAGAVLKRVHSVRAAGLYQGYVMHLRSEVYRIISETDWAYYTRLKSSRFVHALTQEIERVNGAAAALVALFVRSTMALLYLGLAVMLSPLTTLLVTACGAALSLLMLRKTRLGRKRGEAVSTSYEALYDAVTEQLAGMRISKSHGLEQHHVRRFAERTHSTAGAVIDVVRNQSDVSFWLEIGSAVILAGTFFVALELLGLPLASILLLIYLFARLVPMVTGLQNHVHRLVDLLPAYERVSAFVADLSEHGDGQAGGEGVKAPAFARDIVFDNVSFTYGGDDPVVLRGVRLRIAAGQTTAIVGASGAGKSTMADLVVGLVMPTKGTIRVDGVQLTPSVARAWRHQIGYVNQDTFLYHDTVRENLLLVRPDATERDLNEALRAAAADFVLELPEGLDTVVGDRGVRLSGGERQRIALARAILRRPALLVLDEATSALDADNENAIQSAIERMGGHRTILMIAHRLSTVRTADVIYVMDAGRVVEQGSWEALMSDESSRFHSMCRAQGVAPPVAAARN